MGANELAITSILIGLILSSLTHSSFRDTDGPNATALQKQDLSQ
jgi:hypothetical protein